MTIFESDIRSLGHGELEKVMRKVMKSYGILKAEKSTTRVNPDPSPGSTANLIILNRGNVTGW